MVSSCRLWRGAYLEVGPIAGQQRIDGGDLQGRGDTDAARELELMRVRAETEGDRSVGESFAAE